MNDHMKMEQNSNNILLTNIQRFSLHDGPGIRTTVFLKGCSIHCPWCSNPENLRHKEEAYIKKDKNGKAEEEGIYGKWYSVDELYREVIKDKAFYGSCGESSEASPNILDSLPGGVTFSGGECMLQMKELEPLLQKLNQNDIHTAVESSLFCSSDQLSIAISHIDLFYIDIKVMDEKEYEEVLGGRIEIYKKNLESVLESAKLVVFRLPVIGGYTDGEENRVAAVELIKKSAAHKNLLKIELLKEHNLGTNKYQSLLDGGNEISIPDYKGVSDDLMEQYKKEIEEALREVGSSIEVEICKI